MRRDVVFVFGISKTEFTIPKLEAHVRFILFGNNPSWAMSIDIIRESVETVQEAMDDGVPLCRLKTMREVVHTERVQGRREDWLLARAANTSDENTSSDIAHTLFWTHVIQPSVDMSPELDAKNWFKIHAGEAWNFYMREVLREREKPCEEVHES